MAPRKGNEPGSWEVDADKPKPADSTRTRRSFCVKELVTRESKGLGRPVVRERLERRMLGRVCMIRSGKWHERRAWGEGTGGEEGTHPSSFLVILSAFARQTTSHQQSARGSPHPRMAGYRWASE